MTVEELIKQLMDCRSDATVVTSLYDNSDSVELISGVANDGNMARLYIKVAFNSVRAKS